MKYIHSIAAGIAALLIVVPFALRVGQWSESSEITWGGVLSVVIAIGCFYGLGYNAGKNEAAK